MSFTHMFANLCPLIMITCVLCYTRNNASLWVCLAGRFRITLIVTIFLILLDLKPSLIFAGVIQDPYPSFSSPKV